jgi:hypothetical protein
MILSGKPRPLAAFEKPEDNMCDLRLVVSGLSF